MNGYWSYRTKIGEARIILRGDRFTECPWRIEIADEDLGGYPTPESALDDLVGGHTFSHSRCVDTSVLGCPDELSEWEFIRAR